MAPSAARDAPIRLALVNDHALVVAGLRQLLLPYAARVRVVELASQLPVASPVDVLLYDTFGRERIDDTVAEVISETAAKVVLYTWTLKPRIVAEAAGLGVHGFLSKTLSAPELVDAIEEVHAGATVVHPEPEPDASLLEGDWPGRRHGLSVRESEVLTLIAQGLSNQEVAGPRLRQHQLGQDLCPVGVPQDRRHQPYPGSPVGAGPRLRRHDDTRHLRRPSVAPTPDRQGPLGRPVIEST